MSERAATPRAAGRLAWLLPLALGACAAPDGAPAGSLRAEAAPVLWVAGVDGTTGAGSGPGSAVTLHDPLALDSGFMAAVELRRGPWSLLIDGLWVDYRGQTRDLGALTTEVGIEGAIASLAGARRVGSWPVGEASGRTLGLDVYAGGRYAYLDLSVQTQGLGGGDVTRDWVDPFVGLRGELEWSERLALRLAGDVGGFGLASDLVWQADARLAWRPWERVDLFAGYRVLDYDFDEGSGADTLRFDVALHGPLLGLSVRL